MDFEKLRKLLGAPVKLDDEIMAPVRAAQDRVIDPQAEDVLSSTPEEDDYFKNLSAAVAGSVIPVNKAAPLTEAESTAMKAMNKLYDAGNIEAAKAAQVGVNRAVDNANRFREQMKARRLEAIKAAMSRKK